MNTIWYMGAKGRLVPNFIRRGIASVSPPGGRVLDLFAGSGAVSMDLAPRYQVFANDIQEYSSLLLRALVEHGPRNSKTLANSLDFDADLRWEFQRNHDILSDLLGPALKLEAEALEQARGGDVSKARAFFASAPDYPIGRRRLSSAWRRARALFQDKVIAEKRRQKRQIDPVESFEHLMTSYYQNVFFGLRQCIELDSLRTAIDRIQGPQAARKRVHYLACLVCAASISTSGTSHFAQPRSLKSDGQVRAVVRRRQSDIVGLMRRYSEDMKAYLADTPFQVGNRTFNENYEALLERHGRKVDTVYADPPYTADNYSRFYHVLEVLTRYDYPELAKHADGRLAKGRYPVRSYRFQSDFCSATRVEAAFRKLILRCAEADANLVLSYALPTGLLFRQFVKQTGSLDGARAAFVALFQERYKSVELLDRQLMHSGQGDSNIEVTEVLVVCKDAKPTPKAKRLK